MIDFATSGEPPKRLQPKCTAGPWLLFTLADGTRWLFTGRDDETVMEALVRAATWSMPADPVSLELGARDFRNLLVEAEDRVTCLHVDGRMAVRLGILSFGAVFKLLITYTDPTTTETQGKEIDR